MAYKEQVPASHYGGAAYRSRERWNSYWHQISFAEMAAPQTLLEVGIGGGVVARELRARGISVTTLDISHELEPDIVADVMNIPCEDSSFDVVLAAEVLEHIRFEDVPQALCEITRVAKTHVVISLPRPGRILLALSSKLPFFRVSILLKIPFFWKKHSFNGEHYWELGKRGYSVRRFLAIAKRSGLTLEHSCEFPDDPAHRFFLFTKEV